MTRPSAFNFSLRSVVVLTILALPAFAAKQFVSAFDMATGLGPFDLTVADFNGDGKIDVAIADEDENRVQIFLQTTNNSFHLGQQFAGTAPQSVVTGDFNGDGKQDLAFANASTSVNVYLGNGDGTFTAAPPTSAGGTQLAVGDFNGDGKLDIAVVDVPVSVLLGHGDGTFTLKNGGILPNAVISIAAKDVNGDGKLDLVASAGGLYVFLGNGNGTFGPANSVALPAGEGSTGLAVADFNGDGRPDIATPLRNQFGFGDSVLVLTGNGDGNFTKGNRYRAGLNPQRLTSADFDGDGKLDLAVSNGASDDVTLLRGNGDATFAAGANFVAGLGPLGIVSADVNNDGKLDVLTANFNGNSFSWLPGTGTAFAATNDYPTAAKPLAVATGDFNGDGKLDLVLPDFNQGAGTHILIFPGRGDGKFDASHTVSCSPGPDYVTVGDLNGDSKQDFIVTYSDLGTGVDLSVFLGNGDGTFQSPVNYSLGGNGGFAVAISDVNHDGKVDLVAAANGSSPQAAVLLGNGDGSFQAAQFTSVPNMITLAVGDVNGDGNPDLVAGLFTFQSGNTVSVLLGNGNGTWQAPVSYGPLGEALSVGLGDLDGDGKLDIVTSASANNIDGVQVFLNNGDGTFDGGTIYPGLDSVAILGDFNSDGKLDVLSTSQLDGIVELMYGNGDGTLGNGFQYGAPGESEALAAGDLNDDGALDVVDATNFGRIAIFVNTRAH